MGRIVCGTSTCDLRLPNEHGISCEGEGHGDPARINGLRHEILEQFLLDLLLDERQVRHLRHAHEVKVQVRLRDEEELEAAGQWELAEP